MNIHKTYFYLLLLICSSFPAFSSSPSLRYTRSGSELVINFKSSVEGSWSLTTKDGALCTTGRVALGSNSIHLHKVSSPTDLIFKMEADQIVSDLIEIPAEHRISPLKKTNQAATIYQAPVRTYLAQGSSPEGAGQLAEFTTQRLIEIRNFGVDYIWVTGILEHATPQIVDSDVVKGGAGSYYAIYDSWDVSKQIGTLRDFEEFLDRAHAVGLRVLIDLVANHTARIHETDILCKAHLDFGTNDDPNTFFKPENNYFYIQNSTFTPPLLPHVPGADGVFDRDILKDGIQLEIPAKVTGNDIVSSSPQASDWFETVKLNYGYDITTKTPHFDPRPRTWNQVLDVASYWMSKGVDGFRVDYAHAVPIEFWRFFATSLKEKYPEVFLLAEAYERDHRMRVPGFSYPALLKAGFDSVYHSESYWAMREQIKQPGHIMQANPKHMPAFSDEAVRNGFLFTHYMENHDEVRLASHKFAPWLENRGKRAAVGRAYTAYLGLLPGHLMIHGGQELQEDASIFKGDDEGKTSIFDFIYQSQTRLWYFGSRPEWMKEFRQSYKSLLGLKSRAPFNLKHSFENPSYIDLLNANWYKEQSQWIASYLRFGEDKAYLVVINSDPFHARNATIHFTDQDHADMLGALQAIGIEEESDQRIYFREVFSKKGWEPTDPAIEGRGIPAWMLFKSGGIPSGLYLGEVPAATTYVFEIETGN